MSLVLAVAAAACGGDTPTSPTPTAPATETITWAGTLTDREHGMGTLRITAAGRDGIYIGAWLLESTSVTKAGPALVNLTMLGGRSPAIVLQPGSPPCPNPSSPAALAVFSLQLSGTMASMSGTSTHLTCDNMVVEGRVELVRQ